MIDLRKLPQLWSRHTQGSALSDCPIGLGDVLEIFVPAVEELTNRVVRGSDEGTIFLFYIGDTRPDSYTLPRLLAGAREKHWAQECCNSL
jgi:hypothetical protein